MHTITDDTTRLRTLALYTGKSPAYLRTRSAVRALFYTACAAVPVALTALAAFVGSALTR